MLTGMTHMKSTWLIKASLIVGFSVGSFVLLSAEENLITSLTVTKNKVSIGINEKLKAAYLKSDFFVEYDDDVELSQFEYEIVTMPLITNIISLIWISGRDFYIDSMEQDLFDSLARVKQVYQMCYPKTRWNGNLIPRKLVSLKNKYSPRLSAHAVGCLFSGGLDSTSSALSHIDRRQVLITAWGQYDLPLAHQDIWETRKTKIKAFAATCNSTCSFIKSNYSEFFNWQVVNRLSKEIDSWRLQTVEGLGWSGLTAPILLAKGCSTLYLPSGHAWYYPYFTADCPFVDNNITYAGVHLVNDQFDIARLQKNELIARICKERRIVKPYIKVCQLTRRKDDSNCCACRKCLWTILSFIAFGEDHTEYGFPVTVEKAVHATLKLLKHPMGHFTLWNFLTIQKRMAEQVKTNPELRAKVAPFLAYDIRKKARVKDRSQLHQVQWNELSKVFPAIRPASQLLPFYMDIDL